MHYAINFNSNITNTSVDNLPFVPLKKFIYFHCGFNAMFGFAVLASGLVAANGQMLRASPLTRKESSSSCFVMGSKSTSAPFSSKDVSQFRSLFMNNINIEGSGGVVAAPDHDTPGGNYYYHWMRDAALTMRCVQETASSYNYENELKSYTAWVLKAQSQTDPNGIDVRTEPKFELPNGEVFSGGWCRPQNDGPGLRATALMMFANTLLDKSDSSYVSENLWTGDSSKNGGAIKFDLDYVVDNYQTSTCDLWEEYTSNDLFWNKITMKKAMILGAEFATRMGDSDSASRYTATAQAIDATLYDNHWNGKAVIEATGRTYDGAVIVGFNTGFDSSDNLFAPSSYEVASTVKEYNSMFCSEYSINTQDSGNSIPGVLYGRYQGDIYAGGNPWVLTTAALGNLFYRGGNYVKKHGLPESNALDTWSQVFGVDASDISADTFVTAGDAVMNRLKYHIGDTYHLDEQLDRNTGVQMSAKDLTWSYAEVLNAMSSRDKFFA
jgi:glucoamylase